MFYVFLKRNFYIFYDSKYSFNLLIDIVVESSTCQSFITRQLYFQLRTSTPTIPAPDFSRELQKSLQR